MYIKDVLAIPKDSPLREILEPQGIKSLLTLPVVQYNTLIGFVGFDSVNNHHQYSDKERSILTFFVELLVNVKSRIDSLKQLSEAKIKAEFASKAKADFLSTMSHELRTPLNGVIGTTNLLLDTNPTEEQERLLKALQFSGKALMNIINDILNFSKIESGKVSLQHEVFNLKDLMNSIHSTFQLKAEEKGIELTLKCEDGFPEVVFGDSGKLLQIMNNLIGNAIKFTDEGKVSVLGEFKELKKGEVLLYFEVKDTGIGIAKENFNRIFESFSQEGAYITRRFGGTGLGLAITKKLIELLKGTINVDSQIGVGTVFYFSIPYLIPKVNKKAPKKVKEAVQESPFHLNNAKVLVVEDTL